MCGIAGFFTIPRSRSDDEMRQITTRMTDAMVHRGPDDAGVWTDADTGIALGHRRLSILDLSPLGHQPMQSADGRFMIVFNGEIYNFQDLRAELEPHGHTWRGHSDTEIMLAAFTQWGVLEATKKFNGMFAFALWDRQERVLHLGRDRLGEKPLYYGWVGDTLVFGSELKVLKPFPGFSGEVNRDAIAGLLNLNYIPDPHSIYKGIHKLTPAGLLTWDGSSQRPQPQLYWNVRSVIETSVSNPYTGSDHDAVNELERLLLDAVKIRMISDVPLGAFLSGGVDSSTIVALMQAQSSKPVRTFTIGFHEKDYNEAIFAKEVAQHLGTDHTEMYVTPKDALDVIPGIPHMFDEPFSDYSQIPTYLVSKIARQHVTVSLSGDAGDELFTGYERYFVGKSIWDRIRPMPKFVRNSLAGAMTLLQPSTINTLVSPAHKLLPKKYQHVSVGDKVHKLAEVLRTDDPVHMYHNLVAHWKQPHEVVIGGRQPATALTDHTGWPSVADFSHRMMHLDMETYLPSDILVKVDRAAMAVSLEGRIPLLDPRVMEFAWRLPLSMKQRGNVGKWVLRQVLYKHVPQRLIDRPKQGFSVPIGYWLRSELKDWAEALLDESRLKREGYFNPAPIRQKWKEHQQGHRNWQYYLWDVLMFQAWLEKQ
ncbi:MAG: asparagine synthase (glutamine-hydrolyzing) [Verrucomicrobiaceae bacterium]|nr:asparagine synthase (glutamine-hydrolyzing) [Verrucomicrobiaceae bacterium]